MRRLRLPQRLLRSPSKIPAGPRPRRLHPRSRTCPWLTSPHPRRPFSLWLARSLQTPLVPRSLAVRQLLSLCRASSKVLQSPLRPRQPRQPRHLQLVLPQGLWLSSLGRNQWAVAATAAGRPGRTPGRLWSRLRCCRWYGCALWACPPGLPPQRQGHWPPRSPCEGPCLDGPALGQPRAQGCTLLCDSRHPAWLPPMAC